jgi:hypothetical protein
MSRIECLSKFVFGIIHSRSANLSLIAKTFPNQASDSAYKRLQRFVKQIEIPEEPLAKLIISIIDPQETRWNLVFDRTNWKYGSKHINILFLAICRDGIAIPLFFKALADKKCGNSDCADRIALMEEFKTTFGVKRIGSLMGDREFIGHNWLRYLLKEKIPFAIRLKEGWQLLDDQKNSGTQIISKCFKDLKDQEVRTLGQHKLGSGKKSVTCSITGTKSKQGDLVIIAHNKELEDSCGLYRDRWKIETMFRGMKSSGFQIECSHITDPLRFECLIAMITIAFAICYKAGEIIIKDKPQKIKKHGYRSSTIFRLGLDAFTKAIAQFHTTTKHFKRLWRLVFSPIRV